jgi:hypothetical protein
LLDLKIILTLLVLAGTLGGALRARFLAGANFDIDLCKIESCKANFISLKPPVFILFDEKEVYYSHEQDK